MTEPILGAFFAPKRDSSVLPCADKGLLQNEQGVGQVKT